MNLLSTITTTIQREHLIQAGDLIVLAVSGGPDSLAMLYALNSLRSLFNFQIHVAHLDHQLRPESADEARFVAQQATVLGLPCTIACLDVAALAHHEQLNEYAAGRMARYAMLSSIALELGASSVAVAHTADDQAETVLLHLLRGAGTEGMAAMSIRTSWEQWAVPGVRGRGSGVRNLVIPHIVQEGIGTPSKGRIPPSTALECGAKRRIPAPSMNPLPLGVGRGWGHGSKDEVRNRRAGEGPELIRPLLEVSRAQVEAYCTALALEPRRDPANQDTRHMRSRIRHELIPQLIEYNPHIVDALCRTASICAEDQAYIQAQLDECWAQLVEVQAGRFAFRGRIWQQLALALQRAALRRAHSMLTDTQKTLELSHIEEACRLISAGVGHQRMLPGAVQLLVGYNQDFELRKAHQNVELTGGPQLTEPVLKLELPTTLDLGSWVLQASLEEQAAAAQNPWEIYIDAAAIIGHELMLRRRRPGDRMRPAGGAGSRSIQNLMVDAKLPRELRAAWPLLVSDERILWVAGLRAAEGVVCKPGQGSTIWISVRIKDEG